ncbi:pancreatic lipase-related protein 2-like [Sabethes cyaneus]|uniref:pancreatic lipase-related protein 2-like n=1 Tax=Sabethes cyaneus TaxID=53552 RepID=UPI00237E0EA8|nr:pancreatic lipase-related protein 2-like [Sabethes cyaneus]
MIPHTKLWIILTFVSRFAYGIAHEGVKTKRLEAVKEGNIFFEEHNCESRDKFAIIVHGWNETCSTEWVLDMVSNLTHHRGGCIVCMDYDGIYSVTSDYFTKLMPRFQTIVDALVGKLFELEAKGFNPEKGFLFGFSFGARIALQAGQMFGHGKLGRIDACEPAGPGFDADPAVIKRNPQLAARNVQCIHTSSLYGTFRRECHQDWNMGNCGRDQPAAGPYPKGSHGLCPYFYNSAFANQFRPIPKPPACLSFRAVADWPTGFRMGYFSDVESNIIGDLFAPTTNEYPYNEITDANEL